MPARFTGASVTEDFNVLVLSRRLHESIKIGDDITVTITKIEGQRVRIGIEAPPNVKVVRDELVVEQSDEPQSRK